jgi:UDP-N-acetylmuramate dehydrogenase
VRLAEHTTVGLGGPAAEWIVAEDETELIAALRDLRDQDVFLLGGGSNVVVADEGFPGTVIKVATLGTEWRRVGDTVQLTVAAGEDWEALVGESVSEGMGGLELLSGIPGCAGAGPQQNLGAYDGQLKETLRSVRVFDRLRDEVRELSREQCRLTYRNSRFKREPGRFAILAVSLALDPGGLSKPLKHKELLESLGARFEERVPVATVRQTVIALRKLKGMVLDEDDLDTRSTGSFFTNPVLGHAEFETLQQDVAELRETDRLQRETKAGIELPAAWLIERAGFSKGHGNPEGIAISGKHALALTNRGDGTTGELVALARTIAARVEEKFRITLHPEPDFKGHAWIG